MSRSLALTTLFLLATIAPAAAQTTPFTKVADTATPVPGGTGNFAAFSNMVSVDSDGSVAFSENNSGGPDDGIYLGIDGLLSLAAGLGTDIPNGTGTFLGFSFFGNGFDDGIVAFRGSGSDDQAGVYAFDYNEGTPLLDRIADKSTTIPDGTGTFTSFTTAYVDEGDYAFIASGDSDQQGIYHWDGMTLTRIADKNSTVPDIGGTYNWSSQLGFDGGNLAFWANVQGGTAPGNIIGGYTPGGGLVTLVTTATNVPELATPFTGFTSPADLSGTTVAFRGAYAGGGEGIFTIDLAGGAITTVAKKGTPAPGNAGGTFTTFSPPCIDGDVIAFQASTTSGVDGIYLLHEGRLRKVITDAEQLDGKSINTIGTSFGTSENCLGGGYLGFRAHFADTTTGIFRLTISELVDDVAVVTDPVAKVVLAKKIKKLNKKLKSVRKSGKLAKAKRLAKKVKKLRKKLRLL